MGESSAVQAGEGQITITRVLDAHRVRKFVEEKRTAEVEGESCSCYSCLQETLSPTSVKFSGH